MRAMAHEWSGCSRPQHHGRGPGHHRHRHGGPGGGFDFEGGFGPFGRGGRGGRRAGRGDARVAALVLLAEEPRNGYALMQEIEQRSEGVWRPSPGSMYPALAQLEDEGLIRAQEGGGSGRTFALTDAGQAHVEEHRERLGEPWKAASGGLSKDTREMQALIRQVVQAAVEVVARSGNDEQRRQALTLLADTRRGLYRILAGDEE